MNSARSCFWEVVGLGFLLNSRSRISSSSRPTLRFVEASLFERRLAEACVVDDSVCDSTVVESPM